VNNLPPLEALLNVAHQLRSSSLKVTRHSMTAGCIIARMVGDLTSRAASLDFLDVAAAGVSPIRAKYTTVHGLSAAWFI